MQRSFNNNYFFTKFTLNQLFSLGAHVGHLRRRLNKSMSIFLLGFRNGLVCIDLNFTVFFLRRAVNFFRSILKSRGSAFFFITNWAPLQRYFRAKFTTRLHFWYSGPFLGGLISNVRSVRYSKKVHDYGNFFRTKVLIPDVVILFDSATFFYVYRDAFLLGLPSIGFVDTDLDYQNILYPIILNNSSVKINFLYSVFFLNVLKQEQFLERFLLIKDVPFEWLLSESYRKKPSSALFTYYLRRFLIGNSFDSYKLRLEDKFNVSKINKRIRLFIRRNLVRRINRFRRLRSIRRRRYGLKKKNSITSKLKIKYSFFDLNLLKTVYIRPISEVLEVSKEMYDGFNVLRQLKKKRPRFFFVKSKLLFLRNHLSEVIKLRKLNFSRSLLLLKMYRQYLMATIFSKRSFFRRLLKKLQLSAQLYNELLSFGSLDQVFKSLHIYFLKRDRVLLRRLIYISTRILTLLGSSRRKTTVMTSRLGDSFAFDQATLIKDFYKKSIFRELANASVKVVRKVKVKGGYLVVKRIVLRKKKNSVVQFPAGVDVKALKRMRLRHARSIIEAKSKYYEHRRSLYDYNNLLNSRFKVERSMFKNLSGLVKKGLFRRSHLNDKYVLRNAKKPQVIYSEINPKSI